jgi:hemerythrin-like metal-binding protein
MVYNSKKDLVNEIKEKNLFIKWKNEYKVGVPIFDEQHRGLVTIINSLHYGIQTGSVENKLSLIVEMINAYAQIHFAMEEELFIKTDFPNTLHHIEQHKELLSKQNEFGRKCIAERDALQFQNFLKQWWLDHIVEEDLQFGEYLKGLEER